MLWATPPRFVIRTLIAIFATVAFVLSAVLLVVTWSVHEQVRRSVVEKLHTSQRLLASLEQRRAAELRTQVAALSENPTLKAALDTYQAERASATEPIRQQLIDTIRRELAKLAATVQPDVLAARDADGLVLAVAGRRAGEWPSISATGRADAAGAFLAVGANVFRTITIPVTLQDSVIGSLQLGQALDQRYADELSALAGAHTLVLSDGRVVATTLPADVAAAWTADVVRNLGTGEIAAVGESEYAVRPLLRDGETSVYVLDSVDALARTSIGAALQRMAIIGLGAFALAGIASLWLARAIARPIDTLSTSLADMTRLRTFDRPLPPSGESREVDTLMATFNSMIQSVKAAEAETQSAYLGAIRALAMALDARDPYTAGHSERVSALSVSIGRQLALDPASLEVLRLGALLHDIGKIGISDHLLRKPTPLTPDEYEVIKTHPTVGSRILRSVRFLEPHLPIVELHHERPDGRGYPHGLQGEEIPILARIVHVADAFDAITSARAYRPARPYGEGLRELWRCSGTDFDAEVVQALAAALHGTGALTTAPSGRFHPVETFASGGAA